MEKLPWFKFYAQDWLTDLKVRRLSVTDRLVYITMLCLASASSDRGSIINATEEDIFDMAHLSDSPSWEGSSEREKNHGAIKRIEEMGMITVTRYFSNDGRVTPRNAGELPMFLDIKINAFDKRQNSNFTVAERQARFREKHNDNSAKSTSYKSNSSPVTLVTKEQSRGDKSIKTATPARVAPLTAKKKAQ